MLFMNEFDIRAAEAWAESENWSVTLEAVAILERLRDWADQNSDGWAYWPLPCRSARRLMERIQEQERKARGASYPATYDMTYTELRAALTPIKSFLTRHGVSESDRLWILEGKRAEDVI